ncbi:MAG: hypothetical protein HRT47_09720 [Candidatus Caenarcaniphilales bacterium]|nr:hypothetical protein [Candidatus Caenarcaniphilales bacterium]
MLGIGLGNIIRNPVGLDTFTSEFDNAWDAFHGTFGEKGREPNKFSHLRKDANPNHLLAFAKTYFLGEIAGDIGGADGITEVAASIASSLTNPLDWAKDLGSGISILTRAAAEGDLDVMKIMEAGGYIAGAIPVLGTFVDIAKFNKLFNTMIKTGGEVSSLNKTLDSALDAAKANTTGKLLKLSDDAGGKILKVDDLFDSATDLSKIEGWDSFRKVTVDVADGKKIKTLKMEDAIKKYKKKPSAELKKSIETTVDNYNAGAKNAALRNLDKANVHKVHDDHIAWTKMKDKKIPVDGTDMSFDDILRTTDANKLKDIEKALGEYNNLHGSKLSIGRLKELQGNYDEWFEVAADMKDLKLITNLESGNASVLTFNRFSDELSSKKEFLMQTRDEFIEEAKKTVKLATPYMEGGAKFAGKTAARGKKMFLDPFVNGWKLVTNG